jgi:cyclopropane-fatty-acyl-phospholipid synthase
MHYSCAYFEHPGQDLESAQQAKCRHIAAKLLLRPDDRVLDIGSGWGGLALYLASRHKARVTGLTLSTDQYASATQRAQARRLEGRVDFRMQDYRQHIREHAGEYDAIVSVGMFEHVGRPQYPQYFDGLRRLLKPGGRVLLHTIGRSTPPVSSRNWVQKYIFPGGYIPALSELSPPLERSGLVLCDLEVWRLHYADTLAHWHERFRHARAEFASRLGERFCRMWEFYLQACEAMFRWGDLVVFQLQMSDGNAGVPLTRDYLYPAGAGAVGEELPRARSRAAYRR